MVARFFSAGGTRPKNCQGSFIRRHPSNTRLASRTALLPSTVARIFFALFAIPATSIEAKRCRLDPFDTGRSCVIQVT